MAKTADEARKAAMKAKRGFPKGGGKGLKGSNLYTPVSQATIDKIKSQGMAASLKKAATSSNASYVQGVVRMYGATRLAAAKKAAAVKPMQRSARVAERSTPMKAKLTAREAERRTPVAKKSTAPMRKKSTTTDPFAKRVFGGLGALGRTLSVEPRVTAAQVKARAEERKRAAAKKNK
jgi:hypothetical protein